MANCNTAQKKRGLKTHPCRTPPVMLSFFLASTCRSVSSYSFEIFQSMCSEIACSSKLFQSAGQWTRSNAFDKFKRTTHTGIPTSKALSTNALAVKGFSSMRLPQQNDENRVAFRLVVIKLMFDFVQNKTCEYFKNKRNISGKSATCCGRIFVGNMLNKRTTIEALRRDNRYHCTLATNAPRTLLEHVSTPLLSDPHHPRTHAFPTQVPHDPTPPNPTMVQAKRSVSPHVVRKVRETFGKLPDAL